MSIRYRHTFAPGPANKPPLWLRLLAAVVLVVLVLLVSQGIYLLRLQSRPPQRTIPAVLDPSVNPVNQALNGGDEWRVIWWENGGPNVETFENQGDAANAFSQHRYMTGAAVFCRPNEPCDVGESIAKANMITRGNKK